MRDVTNSTLKKRRSLFLVVITVLLLLFGFNPDFVTDQQPFDTQNTDVLSDVVVESDLAREVLDKLLVKGRAPKAGYSRSEFGSGWATIGDCDTRNKILARDMSVVAYGSDGCVVLRGVLLDPYTNMSILFKRGASTSGDVQIDHVVALSDAWQKGAQQLDFDQRLLLANDPLNLLAVDGPANQQKGDSDAASWLPANKSYRCQYVARQIAVKQAYSLWVTEAEKAAMRRILNGCGEQRLPIEDFS